MKNWRKHLRLIQLNHHVRVYRENRVADAAGVEADEEEVDRDLSRPRRRVEFHPILLPKAMPECQRHRPPPRLLLRLRRGFRRGA